MSYHSAKLIFLKFGDVCFTSDEQNHGFGNVCTSQILFKRKRVAKMPAKCSKILSWVIAAKIISSSKRGSTSMIPIKWMFPKIGGNTPKWMVVYNGKPYWNGWFRGFSTPLFFGNIQVMFHFYDSNWPQDFTRKLMPWNLWNNLSWEFPRKCGMHRWLNPPIWQKICPSQIGHVPQIGVKIKLFETTI